MAPDGVRLVPERKSRLRDVLMVKAVRTEVTYETSAHVSFRESRVIQSQVTHALQARSAARIPTHVEGFKC